MRPSDTPQAAGRRAERDEVRRRGARPVPASGALPGSGGDFEDDGEFLVEHKWTARGSYSLRKVTWEKIRREAHQRVRIPKMVINIDGLRLEVVEAP